MARCLGNAVPEAASRFFSAEKKNAPPPPRAQVLGGAAPYHSLPASFTMAYFHVPSCLGFRFWRRMLNDPVSSGLVENLVELDNAVVGEALKATKRGLVVVCAAQVAAVALVLGAWALPAALLPGGFGAVAPHANGGLAFVRAHGLVMWSLFALVISSTIGRYRRPAAATMFERSVGKRHRRAR